MNKKQKADYYLERYLHSDKVILSNYTFIEDYVTDKMREIIMMRNIRNEPRLDFDTIQVMTHRLYDVANSAGLSLKCERF